VTRFRAARCRIWNGPLLYPARCLWHARFRAHSHCWECEQPVYDGRLLCAGCRGGNVAAVIVAAEDP